MDNSNPFKTFSEDATARTWTQWSLETNALLWQAVALHSGLEPDSLDVNHPELSMVGVMRPKSGLALFLPMLDAAVLHVQRGTLPTVEAAEDPRYSTIQLSAYALWAKSLKLELPPQFPAKPYVASQGSASISSVHQTRLLTLLMEASTFWKTVDQGGNYDPTDPTTAPTNAQVEAWLEQRGVSKKVREVMATILRADDMPSGPRVSKEG